MPDRRFSRPYPKKSCRCKHGISAHHKKITSKSVTHPCWYPGCKCGDYRRYDASKTNQTFSTVERFATGIRNAEGFAIDSRRRIFVTQHGRDQLRANWPDLYKPDQEATQPAEE